MVSVLTSIQPYYVFLIIARKMGWNIPQEKTTEIRKGFPTSYKWDKRSLIYCSKNKRSFNRIPEEYQPFMAKLLGKVVGEFICDRIDKYESEFWNENDDYMSKNHSMEQIRRSYYADPDDWECEEEFDYVTGNEVENPDDCDLCKQSCVSYAEIRKYIGEGLNIFYTWRISDLKLYDEPKALSDLWEADKCPYCLKDGCTYGYHCYRAGELNRCGDQITHPPQSWRYISSEVV